MATLNATFLDDLGRVRLELVDATPDVRYQIQRSTAEAPAWVDVRGAQNMSTAFTTVIDDYEYTPNIVNTYRLLTPSFYDTFNRDYPAPTEEGFESLPLSLTIGDGGSDAPWARSTTQSHMGTWSLQAGSISDSETTDAEVTVPANADTLRFWYRVSSEESFDDFVFLIDGVEQFSASGEVDWTQSNVYDISGASTFTFRYIKDSSVSESDDTAWVDDIVITHLGTDWGTATTGQSWNLGASSPGFSAHVDNGVGVLASTSPSGDVAELTTDPIAGAVDAELTWSAIYPDSALDSLIEFDVGMRAADSNNFYESQLIFEDDDGGTVGDPRAVFIRIAKFVGGSFMSLTDRIELGTWTPDIAWHARFRVQGSTLQLRAWEQGTDEPQDWQVTTTDTELTTGTAIHVRGRKNSGDAYAQWFGPMELNTIPQGIADTTSITPMQSEVFLKSITYPLFNRALDCVDWQELVRNARTGFFDVKGRHEILGVADVGSSATFDLTFLSHSKAENRAIVALLTYGGVMLLQPPGDDETIDCPTEYSGIPEGYVMVSEYTQGRTVYGKPLWTWTATFTRVAASDADAILPTTITWAQLWDLIGPDGTWEDVWASWPTWQALWLTAGNPVTFGDLA